MGNSPPKPNVGLIPPVISKEKPLPIEKCEVDLFGIHTRHFINDYLSNGTGIRGELVLKPPIENEDLNIRTFTNIDINLPHDHHSSFDGGVKVEGNYDNKTNFLGTIENRDGPYLSFSLKHNLFNHLNVLFNGSPTVNSRKGYMGASYEHPSFTVGSSLNYSYKDQFNFDSYDIWGVIKNNSISAGFKALFNPNHSNVDYVIGANIRNGNTPISKPKFELSFLIKNFKTYHLTYFQHFVARRKIYNHFEEKHVTHITNYFDLGFEMVADEKNIDLKIAGSYQLNKNNMVKARIDKERVQATYILKTWIQPSVSVALTSGFNFKERIPEYGLGVTLQNLFGTDYERVSSDYEVTEIRNYRSEVAPDMEKIDPRMNITEEINE